MEDALDVEDAVAGRLHRQRLPHERHEVAEEPLHVRAQRAALGRRVLLTVAQQRVQLGPVGLQDAREHRGPAADEADAVVVVVAARRQHVAAVRLVAGGEKRDQHAQHRLVLGGDLVSYELLEEADDEQLEVGGAQEEREDVDEAAARRVRQPLLDGDERRHFLH